MGALSEFNYLTVRSLPARFPFFPRYYALTHAAMVIFANGHAFLPVILSLIGPPAINERHVNTVDTKVNVDAAEEGVPELRTVVEIM